MMMGYLKTKCHLMTCFVYLLILNSLGKEQSGSFQLVKRTLTQQYTTSSEKKPIFEFDLNEEYNPGNSPSHSIHNLLLDIPPQSSSVMIQDEIKKNPKAYVYKARKDPSKFSQTPKAISKRKSAMNMRKDEKIRTTFLEKEKIRKQKKITYKIRDEKFKEARRKINEGIATQEEKDFVAKRRLNNRESWRKRQREKNEKLLFN